MTNTPGRHLVVLTTGLVGAALGAVLAFVIWSLLGTNGGDAEEASGGALGAIGTITIPVCSLGAAMLANRRLQRPR